MNKNTKNGTPSYEDLAKVMGEIRKKHSVKVIIPHNPLGYSDEYNKKLDQQARQTHNGIVIVDHIILLK